ncbi:Cytochrome P450 3A13-like protein, partial [Dinothrombium tinctorium]
MSIETNTHVDPNNKFKKFIDTFLDLSSWRFIATLLLPVKLQRIFGIQFTPDHVIEYIKNTTKFVLNERKSKRLPVKDFAQLLLDAEDENVYSKEESDGKQFFEENLSKMENEEMYKDTHSKHKKLTFDEIAAQIIILLAGGYHTLAAPLEFCFYALALNPDAQEKLYQE